MDALIIFGAKYLFAVVLAGAAAPLIWLSRERRVAYLRAGLFCALFAFALTTFAGALYFDPRPFTHGVRSLIQHAPDNGFPSDHTVLSFAAASCAFRVSKPLAAALGSVAAAVAVCRVLSGVHSPLDVIAGALIGLAAAALAISSESLFRRSSQA